MVSIYFLEECTTNRRNEINYQIKRTRRVSMDYQKPTIKTISINELKKIIFVNASSDGSLCIEPSLFACNYAAFGNCPTYDPDKCDPFAAPSAGHGNYPAKNENIL